jgi:hypothetical protein
MHRRSECSGRLLPGFVYAGRSVFHRFRVISGSDYGSTNAVKNSLGVS